MTTPTTVLNSTSGEVQAAIDAGMLIASPATLDAAERFHVITAPGYAPVVVDLASHAYWRDRPVRKRGTVTVNDAASFVAYITKHGLPESEIYADVTTPAIVGVLNAHRGVGSLGDLVEEAEAGFGDHRVQLKLHRTNAWKAWLANDRKLLGQVDFAEHLEERLVDISEPAAADLLELAQSFNAKRAVSFESSNRLSTGEVQVEYRETDTVSGTRKGKIAWRETFALQLVLFEGGQPCRVTGRLRYRIVDGALRIGYLLNRPDDAERAVFDDLTAAIGKGCEAPLLYGTP